MEERLFDQFEQLRTASIALAKSIENSMAPAWIAEWHQQCSLNDILLDLWYHEDQDGRETRVYPGIIALSREQITFANEINFLKDEFRRSIQMVKEANNENWREIQGLIAKRYYPLNEHLSREGLNRLHLKQVFRHIPLVVSRPDKIGFSWYTSGRSIKKLTKQDAYNLLCKLNTESTHIKIQMERLASLQDNEPLARVQNQAPVLRANLVFDDRKKRSMNVSLPLMFPSEGKRTLPEFNIPLSEPPKHRSRLIRSDNKLEDDAFLPSIRVHRYIKTKKSAFY